MTFGFGIPTMSTYQIRGMFVLFPLQLVCPDFLRRPQSNWKAKGYVRYRR